MYHPAMDAAARIAMNLLPAAVLAGQPIQPMTLLERMSHYRVPGVSVAFVDKGRVAWTRAYGYADSVSSRPVTADTVFQAASLSKPVAASAALRLLPLDEDVNRHLKSWQVPENEHTRDSKVTVRRILSHSAGLSVSGFDGYAAHETVPSLLELLDGMTPANSAPVRVLAPPGSRWRYSGGGYSVLQLLLQDFTGMPFAELIARHVLAPLDMRRSGFGERRDDAAVGHRDDGRPLPGGNHRHPEEAAAGLWTTPADYARFVIEIQNAYLGKSKTVIDQKQAQLMLSRQSLHYGLGWTVEPPGREPRFTHSGSNEGFKCVVVSYPERRQALVFMSNGDGGRLLMEEYLRAVAEEYSWPDYPVHEHAALDIPEPVLRGLVGEYAAQDGHEFKITLSSGRLYFDSSIFGPAPFPLLARTGSLFFSTATAKPFDLAAYRDDSGSARRVVVETIRVLDAYRK